MENLDPPPPPPSSPTQRWEIDTFCPSLLGFILCGFAVYVPFYLSKIVGLLWAKDSRVTARQDKTMLYLESYTVLCTSTLSK